MNTEDVVLTGDRPTGKLHLGHFVGSIQNRLKLQDEYKKCYYMIADVQALTDNADNPQKVRDNVLEVALDNLACGLDPKKTTMFIQSQIPEIAELTVLFLNLVTVARLKRNPTVKAEMKQKGFGEDVPAGFLMYPISQAADILSVKGNIVPVGDDQLPVLEQANEIIDSFNRIYGQTFSRIKGVSAKRLIGIDGDAKMSKSLGNTINLSDDEKTIIMQVRKMYTDPTHIHKEDPGKVEGNVVFAYLDIFDSNKDEVAELKKQYKKGGLGDMELKNRLSKLLNEMIAPIRTRREELAKNPEAIMQILEEGTKKVRKEAQKTLAEVKEKLKIAYF
ncbi:MAG: tryptophan--tRNA ligase [Minisyncoccia bacterium]